MTALTAYRFKAPDYIKHKAAHTRAMRRPMTGIAMMSDPMIPARTDPVTWRKCQYAAWLAMRDGRMEYAPHWYTANASGNRVAFRLRPHIAERVKGDHHFIIILPAHDWSKLIEADFTALPASAAALPAPEAGGATPRCSETPDAFEAIGPALPAPLPRSNTKPLRLKVTWPARELEAATAPADDAVVFVRSRRARKLYQPTKVEAPATIAIPAPIAAPQEAPPAPAPALPAATLPAPAARPAGTPRKARRKAPKTKRVHFLIKGRFYTANVPAG